MFCSGTHSVAHAERTGKARNQLEVNGEGRRAPAKRPPRPRPENGPRSGPKPGVRRAASRNYRPAHAQSGMVRSNPGWHFGKGVAVIWVPPRLRGFQRVRVLTQITI